jgi:hypothetical protein
MFELTCLGSPVSAGQQDILPLVSLSCHLCGDSGSQIFLSLVFSRFIAVPVRAKQVLRVLGLADPGCLSCAVEEYTART